MSNESIAGSCLCGEVRFELRPPFSAFRYCYCGRCRKASGAAHAANIVVPQSQLKWTAGESLTRRFDLPGAKRFAAGLIIPELVERRAGGGQQDHLS